MMHAKSDSDATSLDPSSPRSPKGPLYFVQSPSRDSRDGDKSSSMHATPMYNSPMESPSHPSFGRHSRTSSASRVSGALRSLSGNKFGKKRNDKGWPECNVIEEEGPYNDDDEKKGLSRRCQLLIAFLAFVLLFTLFSLIIWGASRSYKAEFTVRSLTCNDFHFMEGADHTGVITKMATTNCSLKLYIYNPAGLFGIHVTVDPIDLVYSEIPVATGQLKNYYQPRSSRRVVSLELSGDKIPLYGAGASLAVSNGATGVNDAVPLTLDFQTISKGYVIGLLVTTTHRKHVTCSVVVDSSLKPIIFKDGACTYN